VAIIVATENPSQVLRIMSLSLPMSDCKQIDTRGFAELANPLAAQTLRLELQPFGGISASSGMPGDSLYPLRT
jgi:hypothetical protein